MVDYSLIIPFFNEEKNIPLVLKKIKKIYKKSKNLEFILVNNGSNDRSEIIFKRDLNKKDKRIRYFKIKKNIGYGYGIKYGLKKSKGKYVGWTHSDMQTDPTDILKAIKLINLEKDKEIFVKGKRQERSFRQSFQTTAMEFFTYLILGYNLRDINAQPNIVTRQFYQKYLRRFAPNDLSFDLFTYYFNVKANYRVKKINVIFKSRKFGETKGGGEGGSILTKIKLIFVTLKCLFKIKFMSIN
tara:strand:+ start:116 stop:841 length:726 start_codon:yes stop_codon:yes gene_type:complete